MLRPRRKKDADPLPPWPPNSEQREKSEKSKYWKVTDKDTPKWSPDRPDASLLQRPGSLRSLDGQIWDHSKEYYNTTIRCYDEDAFETILDALKKCSTKITNKFMSMIVMNAAKDLKAFWSQSNFTSDFIKQVTRDCPELVRTIPDFAKALDALAHIPLDRFSNPKDVLTFVNTLIESGIATQVEHGLVFVLGNTNIGKTSLVNTFPNFVANPSEEPVSVLTEGNDNLRETQVLEIYDNLSLNQEKAFKVELARGSFSPVLVNLKDSLKNVAVMSHVVHFGINHPTHRDVV